MMDLTKPGDGELVEFDPANHAYQDVSGTTALGTDNRTDSKHDPLTGVQSTSHFSINETGKFLNISHEQSISGGNSTDLLRPSSQPRIDEDDDDEVQVQPGVL